MFDFSIKDFSIYRRTLMGFSIIWVMLFHYKIDGLLLEKIANYGYMGVDVFFFLSGFGLFYSMEKNSDTIRFYIRRVRRIFPLYFILGAFSCVLFDNFSDFLWKYSTLGYWTNGIIASWFIPAIVTCYFLYPFLFYTIFYNRDIKLFCIVVFTLILFVSYLIIIDGPKLRFDNSCIEWNRMMFWYRLPIFIYGSLVASWVKDNKKDFYVLIMLLAIFPAIIFYLRRETMSLCFSTTFVTPLVMFILISLIKKTPIIARWGGVIGDASLEIFMIHMPIYYYINHHSPINEYLPHNFVVLLIATFVIILGIIIHKLFPFK